MKKSKRLKKTRQEKPKQNTRGSSVDILSQLVDMHLQHIAGDILFNLSEIDISNAVVANPKWSAIATGRRRLEQLFSRNKGNTAPLKAFYRREELLAQQTQDQLDVPSLFLRACIKCSSLSEPDGNNLPNYKQGNFSFHVPVEHTVSWECSTIHISDAFIAVILFGFPKKKQKAFSVQLFDRWTFQLVNALTVNSITLLFRIVEQDAKAVFISCMVEEKRRAFFWHLTTGKLQALTCPARIHRQSFCIGKLLVLLWTTGGQLFATVYKVPAGADDAAVCIAHREPLHVTCSVHVIPSAEELDWFAITNAGLPGSSRVLVQVRSKRDFSLLHNVTDRPSPLGSVHLFLLSDCLSLGVNGKKIEVKWLLTNKLRTVYRFRLPKEMRSSFEMSGRGVANVGGFLVYYLKFVGLLNVAIWKLPNDFIETCRRHFERGTVGIASQCDQLIAKKPSPNRYMYEDRIYASRFDRFGILRCYFSEPSTAVHVTILNSIISDGDE